MTVSHCQGDAADRLLGRCWAGTEEFAVQDGGLWSQARSEGGGYESLHP